MEGGHAVHRVAEVDVQVGHVDNLFALLPLEYGHLGVGMGGAGPRVQLPDDGHQLGGNLLNEGEGPLLQRLGQDGVVGVGAGLGHLLHRRVHGQAPAHQQAHQLGDDHGGVGVVDLDGHVVGERLGAAAPLIQLL